jgi:hypothetical protein
MVRDSRLRKECPSVHIQKRKNPRRDGSLGCPAKRAPRNKSGVLSFWNEVLQ